LGQARPLAFHTVVAAETGHPFRQHDRYPEPPAVAKPAEAEMFGRQTGGHVSYWSVVQVQSRMLHQRHPTTRVSVGEHLLAQSGFESYLPRTRTRRNGRSIIAPLFPGYLFVRIVAQWYPIKNTIGVLRLLMNGDEPARLPDQVVTDLRHAEVGGFIRLPKPAALINGDRVRILTGPFRDQVGLYDGQSTRERERILLELLGRKVRIELARTDRIEKVAQASRLS
jgi:transcriptional antiterminator RfaH